MEEVAAPLPRPGLGELVAGVFLSPGRAMAAITAWPSWAAPLVLTTVLIGLSAAVIYQPIIAPMQVAAIEQKSPDMPAEQLDKMDAQMSKPLWAGLIAALSVVIQTPIRLLRAQGLDPSDFASVMEPVTGLGFLIPLDSGSFALGMLRGLLSSIELFWLWQCAVLVEGVACAFERPRSFGITCVAALWALGAILGAVASGFQASS